METTTYTALCERAGRWWTIHVPQIEGLSAQVRSLDQAEVMTRKVIARHLGIPAEAIKVDVLPDAPAPVARALQARHAARQAAEAAGKATREAIDALARDGYPFHDAATMLSLSRGEIEHYGPASDETAGLGSGPLRPRPGKSCLAVRASAPRVGSAVSDSGVIERIDAFCDAVPRERARAEAIGALVLFVPVGTGFPYYARPRTGRRPTATAADVRAVRARQRELLIPESFEWVERTAPDMAAAAAEAGLAVHAHPLLVLGSLAPAPRLPERIGVRVMDPEDPDLILAWAVPGVAFNYPGTAIGEASVTERDKIAADHDAATIELLRDRLRSHESVLATASGPNGPLAAGSYQLADGTAEITGIGVLPASRRRGLAAGVTRALAAHALARGARTVFLSATDATVARIYVRLGFREIGTAMIAEPPPGD